MKISVLTVCFNCGKYLDRAIASVLKQKYKNWEHIIVDGNSTDNTLEVLRKYQHLMWISEPDHGQSDAMNKAFSMASGDLIVYLNADDWFEHNAFELVIKEYIKCPLLDMVVGNLNIRLNDGQNFINKTSIPFTDLNKIVIPFKYPFPLNPVSYFYKKDLQLKIGPFPIDNHYAMDYWFLLRAFLFAQKIVKIDKTLGCFYLDGTNKTSNIDVNRVTYNVVLSFVKSYKKSLIFKVLFNYWILVFLKEYFIYGKYMYPIKTFLFNTFFKRKITVAEFKSLGIKKSFNILIFKKKGK